MKNICKFTAPAIATCLEVKNFIYETNREAMRQEQKLTTNMAILIAAGTCKFHFDKVSVKAEAGCLLFGFKDELVHAEVNEDTEYMYINFGGARSADIFERFGIEPENRLFDGFGPMIPFWKENLTQASEHNLDLATEGVLLYTFSKFSTIPAMQDSTTAKMIEIMKDNFSDPSFSMKTLSDMLSYNPKYLSHLFKKTMGVSYTEYLRNLRIQFAVSLFNSGMDSIKKVSFLSGYTDPFYFSSVFKKNVGMSPREYTKSVFENNI